MLDMLISIVADLIGYQIVDSTVDAAAKPKERTVWQKLLASFILLVIFAVILLIGFLVYSAISG
ncbi:MAG TPA: hypothetical protein VEC17_00560 [Candidatus Binatia bacterium]|nr:hypothetical protein [Candidatus Binatia bacterium]